jgi:hypothetical protein
MDFEISRLWKGVEYERIFVVLMFVLLPIQKDGPFDLDLAFWKLIIVLLLLAACLPKCNQLTMGLRYQQIAPLLVLMVLLVLISYIWATPRDVATELTQAFITSAAYFIVLCRIIDENLIKMGMFAIAVLLLGASAVAVIQYAVITFHLDFSFLLTFLPVEQRIGYFEDNLDIAPEGVRLPSVFFHSNQFGHFLALVFTIFFPLFLSAARNHERFGYGAVAALALASSLLTQSRAALVLMITSTIVISLVYAKDLVIGRRYAAVLVLVFAFLAGGLFFGNNLSSFVSRIASFDLSYRQDNWIQTVELIPEHLPLGVGMGGSGYHILLRFPPVNQEDVLTSYYAQQSLNYWSENPHNFYLATVLETGIFSLFVQLLFFGRFVWLGIKVHQETRCLRHKALAIGGTMVLGLEFLRGFIESYAFFSAVETGAILAFVCALLLYMETRLPITRVKNA